MSTYFARSNRSYVIVIMYNYYYTLSLDNNG